MKTRESKIEISNFIFRFDMIRRFLNRFTHYKYINVEWNSFILHIHSSNKYKNIILLDIDLKEKVINNLKICLNNYSVSNDYKNYAINLIKLFKKIY